MFHFLIISSNGLVRSNLKTDHAEILQKEQRLCSLQNLFRRVHINLDQEVHVIGYKQ